MAEGTCTKKVLVEHEEDTVPVSFVSGGGMGSDYEAVTEAAATQLTVSPTDLVLKIQSEEWGGRWVNIGENDIILEKAILQAVIRKSAKVMFKILMLSFAVQSLFIFNVEESRSWDDKHYYDYCCQGIHEFDGLLIGDVSIILVNINGSKSHSNAPVFFTRSSWPSQASGQCM